MNNNILFILKFIINIEFINKIVNNIIIEIIDWKII